MNFGQAVGTAAVSASRSLSPLSPLGRTHTGLVLLVGRTGHVELPSITIYTTSRVYVDRSPKSFMRTLFASNTETTTAAAVHTSAAVPARSHKNEHEDCSFSVRTRSHTGTIRLVVKKASTHRLRSYCTRSMHQNRSGAAAARTISSTNC